jgi:hypothetical protein
MRQRKWITFFGLVLLLFTSQLSHIKAQDQTLEPLHIFKDFLQSENISLEEYQILMRETVTVSKGTEPVQMIQDFFPNSTVKKETNDHSTKYFVKYVHKNSQMTEEISVVQDLNNPKRLQLFYVITGNELNEENEKVLLKNINRAHSQYFTKNPSIFTCVKGKSSANIKSNILVDSFQDFTEMITLKSLNEENFTTVSGFSHNLNVNTIPISHTEEMNLQIAVRNGSGSGTSITLGTPILTIEY